MAALREDEMRVRNYLIGVLLMGISAFAQVSSPTSATRVPGLEDLKTMTARFAPTEYQVDISHLSAGDRKALAKLVEASRVIDDIFMTQYWSGDHAQYAKLRKDTSALGKARSDYFWINKSPWSALDGNKAFVPDVPPEKLPGANFYPEDMTKEEFETWVKTLPEDQQKAATGFFTVIRRVPIKSVQTNPHLPGIPETPGARLNKTRLASIPFNEAYKADLHKAAKLLNEAAALTDNATLKDFLTKRAAAFISNDYYESDLAWMDLDAPIDVTIGPYETYNDEIFGYKASYEAYINLRDEKETNKLTALSSRLQEIEDNLPIDPQYRNPKLGAAAPLRVVNQVIGGGDGNHGVQTAAYNLPNDERVITQKGAKRVMLKNVQEAKFKKTLVPISMQVLTTDERTDLSFDWFFTHILAHELCHGLGPHQITVNGAKTTPREQLKELYSSIEEAKADVLGLYALQYMIDHKQAMGLEGVLPAGTSPEKKLYTTYLASTFRSLRFGLHEAHGKGMAIQVNYLLDKGAVQVRPDGTFAIDFTKVKDAVRDLAHDLLMVEANGDYDGAKKMLSMAVIRPEYQKALDRLSAVPVDIKPIFVTADQLTKSASEMKTGAKKLTK
jgi:hypothetical protein